MSDAHCVMSIHAVSERVQFQHQLTKNKRGVSVLSPENFYFGRWPFENWIQLSTADFRLSFLVEVPEEISQTNGRAGK